MPAGSTSKEEAQQSRASEKGSEQAEVSENGVYFFNVIIVYRAMILVGMRHYVFNS